MSHISRIASPMSLCEEDLFDIDKKVETKVALLQQLQRESPAPFLVGTIGDINSRISNLDEELSKYEGKLAIEGRTPERARRPPSYMECYSPAASLRQTTPSEKKYELPKACGKKSTSAAQTKSSDAPRLVELQQYPGWNVKRCNPLPHFLENGKVLDHVITAQGDLRRKLAYRQEFCRLLCSDLQEFILQDSFWWFFLEKFHPDSTNQSRLFQRIASNFVKLLLSAEIPKFRDIFFMSYGNILAQSIYSCFCLAFPQSWRQFDEADFKEMLCGICGEWISGIPPPPRSYDKWDFTALEPEGMRKEEVIKKKKRPDHAAKLLRVRTSSYSSTASSKALSMHSPTGSHKAPVAKKPTSKFDNRSLGQSPKLTARATEIVSEHNALSTISEEHLTSTTESTAMAKIKAAVPKPSESCVAGRSVEFSKNVFNIYGRSPLLAQFSKRHGFQRKSFYDILVNLTLVQRVPAKDAQTYRDIITESRRNVAVAAENFKAIYQRDMKAHRRFCAKQREDEKAFWNKTNKLLAKPRQVHYLSNLILMEMKNAEEDINPVKATATAQAVLSSQSAN